MQLFEDAAAQICIRHKQMLPQQQLSSTGCAQQWRRIAALTTVENAWQTVLTLLWAFDECGKYREKANSATVAKFLVL